MNYRAVRNRWQTHLNDTADEHGWDEAAITTLAMVCETRYAENTDLASSQVEAFATTLYTTRVNKSSLGRTGTGDSTFLKAAWGLGPHVWTQQYEGCVGATLAPMR